MSLVRMSVCRRPPHQSAVGLHEYNIHTGRSELQILQVFGPPKHLHPLTPHRCVHSRVSFIFMPNVHRPSRASGKRPFMAVLYNMNIQKYCTSLSRSMSRAVLFCRVRERRDNSMSNSCSRLQNSYLVFTHSSLVLSYDQDVLEASCNLVCHRAFVWKPLWTSTTLM